MQKDFNDIDKLAREAFDNFEVDFNPEDWKRMEEKLNKKEHLMPHIWLYKGVEAMLLLLLVFTAFNIWYANSDTDSNGKNSHSKDALNNQFADVKNTEIAQSNKKETLSSNKNSASLPSESLNNVNTEELATKANSHNTAKANLSANLKNSTKNSNFENVNVSDNNIDRNSFSGLNTDSKLADELVAPSNNNISIQKDIETFNILSNNEILPIKLSSNKIGPGDEEGKGISIKNNYKFPKIYRRQMRAALYGAADINFANSLGDASPGMSIGAFIENEISERFSIRSGILTSRKSFEKSFIKIYDNSAVEGLVYESKVNQTTTVSMLYIPVFFNTIVKRSEKWRISVNTGVSAAMLTNRFVSGTQRTSINQASGALTNISELNGNNYEKGFFQGGDAAQNFFMTVGLGMDVERQLGDRVTLFVQPMFNYALKTAGLDKDRFNQLSLNVGIKGVLR
jgi:hypothetical protein